MFFRICMLQLIVMAATSTAAMEKQTYVIHMDNTKIPSSVLDQGSSRQWYEAMISSINIDQEERITPPQLLYTYERAVSGFAARLTEQQVEALSKIEGFLSAIPDELLTLHTTHTPQFLGLRPGRGLWNRRNLKSDVIIGVLDTGIWPEHASFSDTGMSDIPAKWRGKCENGTKFSAQNCNKKLIVARAFFKGYESVEGRVNETDDFRSPRDSRGHGTHTAATAGGNTVKNANFLGLANGSAAGMMFSARIAVYKVCWAQGCVHSDLLAAIDQAVADGVDVISISVGATANPFYSDNVAIASFGAAEKGVFVSCSAGNSGPLPSSVDNTAPWIMTVAASYTDRSFPTRIKLGTGQTFVGSSLHSGKATKQLPLVYGTTAGKTQLARFCLSGSLDKKLVKGKIVACERGSSGRVEKGAQVRAAGGSGMLLLNSPNGGEELLTDAHVLPASSVGASDGIAIRKYLNTTKKPTASIAFRGTVYGLPALVMAAFSSRGPSSVGPEGAFYQKGVLKK